MEMQFADFVSSDLTHCQLFGQGTLPMGTSRRCSGTYANRSGVGAGPFHSQSNEAWFTHTPGLVVYPAFPADAKVY